MSASTAIPETSAPAAEARFETSSDGELLVRLAGAWRLGGTRPHPAAFASALEAQTIRRVVLDASDVASWDTALLTWVATVAQICGERGVELDRSRLPAGIGRLIQLSEAVPEQIERAAPARPPWIARVGIAASRSWRGGLDVLAFLGRIVPALFRFVTFRARFRGDDLLLLVQDAGVRALPIVTLVSVIVGLILAFVGAVQLQQFGATIYVADLVGIAMVREMGAMMTGIVMAGRTGASYAAQLGSMKVTQEIDALRTMGIAPLDFLVLPRMLALMVMMPLLCLYADVVGILGGAAVGVGLLDLSPTAYYLQTNAAVSITDLVGGIFKAGVYGVLIALAGCLRGMQSGNSSSAVGEATTNAVVTSIIAIVSACGMFAVLFYILGI